MQEYRVGFVTSWKMLTSDRGWYKPILALALLSWVPILGVIAVLGFAYEWARLAAWGIDGAPRRRGIDYGKLLKTGGWTFLILLTMAIVANVVISILFGVNWDMFMPLDFCSTATWGANAFGHRALLFALTPHMLAGIVCQVVLGGFIIAAMMRGAIYDDFAAGWRLDRLFQMIGRDLGGFMRLVGVSALGCAIGFAYSVASSMVLNAMVSAGLGGIGWREGMLYLMLDTDDVLQYLFTLEPSLALGAFLFSVALSFAGTAIACTMQVVAVHAAGMWFRRFDVSRWGLSSDELPDGVPVHNAPRDPFQGE